QKLPSTCKAPYTFDFYDPGNNSLTGISVYSSRTPFSFDSKFSFTLFFACVFSVVLGLHSLQAQITNAPPNEISPWVNDTYPGLIASVPNDVPSLIPLCLGSALDQGNLIDSDLTNTGSISFSVGAGVGGGCDATFAVKDPTNVYPAGTWAGFRIGTTNLLSAMVGLEITIATYYQDNPTGDDITIDEGLVNANLLANNASNVGFVTTQPFDEIRITYETLVGLLYTADIYHASIIRFEEGPALECNTTTPMMRPIYPMSISDDRTDLSAILDLNPSSDMDNVVDSDQDNFATLDFTLGSGSLSVKDELTTYDGGTFAGFDIESTSLLSVGLLDAITITTFLDGAQQETADGSSGGILALNTSILNSGNERSQIGFITSQPF